MIRGFHTWTLFCSFLLSTGVLADECNIHCDGCPDGETVYAGTHEEIIFDGCPEGHVAQIDAFRVFSAERDFPQPGSGEYEVTTSNLETSFFDSPYEYKAGSTEDEVECLFEVPGNDLPIVGDDTGIMVDLNCEATKCDFEWDIQFSCAELGILQNSHRQGVQVLSDIDDTITCSNGNIYDPVGYVEGKDTRLEHKEMYPGVAELHLALALGRNANIDAVPARPLLLSARPRELEPVLAIDQDNAVNVYYEEVGAENGRDSFGINVDKSMYGTVTDYYDWTEMGQTKARSFEDQCAEKPNTRFLFHGDNGQGDACAAQSMLESANSDQIVAVLIHQIIPMDEAESECQHPNGDDFAFTLEEGPKVHYHETHADATEWVLSKGLIDCCSALDVFYAIEEWIECRCEGSCQAGGLTTGPAFPATRPETLEYCDVLNMDQLSLLSAIQDIHFNTECPCDVPTN